MKIYKVYVSLSFLRTMTLVTYLIMESLNHGPGLRVVRLVYITLRPLHSKLISPRLFLVPDLFCLICRRLLMRAFCSGEAFCAEEAVVVEILCFCQWVQALY